MAERQSAAGEVKSEQGQGQGGRQKETHARLLTTEKDTHNKKIKRMQPHPVKGLGAQKNPNPKSNLGRHKHAGDPEELQLLPRD